MSRRRKQAQGSRSATKRSAVASNPLSAREADGPLDMAVRYAEACGLAAQGQYDEARRIYAKLDAVLAGAESEARLRALIRSDLAAVAAIDRRFEEALAGWRAALEIDPDCLMARLNRDLIEAELSFGQMIGDLGELKLAPAPVPSQHMGDGSGLGGADLHLAGVDGWSRKTCAANARP
jgi:tetratricopeptide (TPR) repeat protein